MQAWPYSAAGLQPECVVQMQLAVTDTLLLAFMGVPVSTTCDVAAPHLVYMHLTHAAALAAVCVHVQDQCGHRAIPRPQQLHRLAAHRAAAGGGCDGQSSRYKHGRCAVLCRAVLDSVLSMQAVVAAPQWCVSLGTHLVCCLYVDTAAVWCACCRQLHDQSYGSRHLAVLQH